MGCPDNVLGEKFKYLVRQLLLPAQRALLARLCVFLHKLSKNQSKTLMDCLSLATCFVFLINPETNFAAKQSKPAEKKPKHHRQRKSREKKKSADEKLLATIRAEVEQTKFRITVIETLISRAPRIFLSSRALNNVK